jgi:hypothetical protein
VSCAHQQALLRGEAPGAPDAAHVAGCPDCGRLDAELRALDALAASLPAIAPPPALRDQVAAAMQDALRAPSPSSLRRVRRAWLGGTMSLTAAAALLLVALRDPPPPAAAPMVERGVGERAPDVALKIAVERQGQLGRLSQQGRYEAGDLLYFRGTVDQSAQVGLLRVDAAGARLVHAQALPAGEADLRRDGGPLAWRIDPGEGPAVWALVAGAAPPDSEALRSALASAYAGEDADAVCRGAVALGLRCAALAVATREAPR